MKTSIILASVALAASAFALAEPSKGYGKGKGKGHWAKDNGKGPIPFTSTYSVVATPHQVVNTTEDGSFVLTGGLPVRSPYHLAVCMLTRLEKRVPSATMTSGSTAITTCPATYVFE